MLNDLPREKLKFIIDEYGRSAIRDANRCRELLRKLAPEHLRETNLLMLVLTEGFVWELNAENWASFAQRLHDEFGTKEEFAFWAIESWALALDIISVSKIDAKANTLAIRFSKLLKSPTLKEPTVETVNEKKLEHEGYIESDDYKDLTANDLETQIPETVSEQKLEYESSIAGNSSESNAKHNEYNFDATSADFRNQFEKYIRDRAKELGISISKLAEITGVSRQSLYDIFSGSTQQAKLSTIVALANALKIDSFWLLGQLIGKNNELQLNYNYLLIRKNDSEYQKYENLSDFAKYIKIRAKQLGLSITRLAQDTGISRQSLYDIFSGETAQAKISTVILLAHSLDTNPMELFHLILEKNEGLCPVYCVTVSETSNLKNDGISDEYINTVCEALQNNHTESVRQIYKMPYPSQEEIDFLSSDSYELPKFNGSSTMPKAESVRQIYKMPYPSQEKINAPELSESTISKNDVNNSTESIAVVPLLKDEATQDFEDMF